MSRMHLVWRSCAGGNQRHTSLRRERTMFKFGFGEPDADEASAEPGQTLLAETIDEEAAWLVPLPPLPASAADSAEAAGIPDVFDVVEFAGGGVHLRKCAVATPPSSLAPGASDLVAGRYEGGYKLWECAGDLICFLHKNMRETLEGGRVVELGAGHALPAMFAAQAGAAVVDVADFNEQVLVDVTATNIRLNCEPGIAGRIRMIAGDWDGVPAALGGEEYDVVLAAEATYAPESLARLARCLLRMLKVGGTGLVAGKSYYFGVGGGMRAFEKAVHAAAEERKSRVAVDIAEEIRDGKSNVREILRVVKVEALGKS